jgi:hypothetical protein
MFMEGEFSKESYQDIGHKKPQEVKPSRKAQNTSKRLLRTMLLGSEMFIDGNKLSIQGKENLLKIPEGRKVIFATSHISDIDVQLAAYAVGQELPIKIVSASTHRRITRNPFAYIGERIAGQKNFIPISYDKENGIETGQFIPSDFDRIKNAMELGNGIVIAASNPSRKEGVPTWELPTKGGYGAVYLAQKTGALIVPVAVSIDSDKPIGLGGQIGTLIKEISNRAGAQINIGTPIELEKTNIDEMEDILNAHRNGKGTLEQHEKFKKIKGKLQQQSSAVMQSLAEMLPRSKRGHWA